MTHAPSSGPALPPQQPMFVPAGTPLVQAPPAPNVNRSWKIWPVGIIVVALVGGIGAAALVVFTAPHPGDVTSSAHFTHCALGTNYEPNTGAIQGEGTSFPQSEIGVNGGVEITLVCFVASHANVNDVTDQVKSPDSTLDLPPDNDHAEIGHRVLSERKTTLRNFARFL